MVRSGLGLVIGNSRLHWAWFEGDRIRSYDMPHLSAPLIARLTQQLDFAACGLNWPEITPPPGLPLWLASVVPAQIGQWQAYAQMRVMTLDQIPLAGLYPTLGVDRALVLLGAVTIYGAPSLVIDAGTALTFTGADAQGALVGGAILPGWQLQLRALGDHTAALPQISTQRSTQRSTQPARLPERWSRSTADAMVSGVLYMLLASLHEFVAAWRSQYPDSSILITGGDAVPLLELLHQHEADLAAPVLAAPVLAAPVLAAQIRLDSHLIFRGMAQAISGLE